MEWFSNLDSEVQDFIKMFVLSSGSLKHLAEIYGISYPTVRMRLDQIIAQIQLFEQQNSPFEARISQMVVENKLPLDIAKEIIIYHKGSMALHAEV